MKALEVYCDQHALKVDEWMQDIGSGLNYRRTQFNRLMEMVELGQVRRIPLLIGIDSCGSAMAILKPSVNGTIPMW